MHGASHLLCVIAGSMGLAALGSGATRADTINISTWAHGAPLQEAVIATQPDLLKLIPGEVKWLPISNGPAALAGMKGGAYNIIRGFRLQWLARLEGHSRQGQARWARAPGDGGGLQDQGDRGRPEF